MQLTTIIIDDEPIARKGLQSYAEKISFLHLSHVLPDALSALEIIDKEQTDLLILDINLPELSGLAFLRSMKQAPATIIITAYPEYALDGFELDVVDYLVKPVSFERFLKAATKAKDFLQRQLPNSQRNQESFFIKEGNRIERIRTADILFIESLQNYVAIYTKTKKHLALLSLKSLDAFLPSDSFIRVHKSYIVNTEQVQSIADDEIIVKDHQIPISKAMKESVLQAILAKKLLTRKG